MADEIIIGWDYKAFAEEVKAFWRRVRATAAFTAGDWPRDYPPSELTGLILGEIQHNPYYNHVPDVVRYTWQGGPFARLTAELLINVNITVKNLVMEHGPHIVVGTTVTFGNLRLQVVDHHPFGNVYLVMLAGWRANITYYLRLWFKAFDLVYRRLILTAAVWNLAHTPPGELPNWRDLKWFQEKT